MRPISTRDQGHNDGEQADRRVAWMESRAAVALKIKPGDLRKLFDNEEYRSHLFDFFDQPERRAVFITGIGVSGSYAIVPSERDTHTGAFDPKRKIMYFLKRRPCKLPQDDRVISQDVAFGDVNVDVLASLHNLSSGVLLPLLEDREAASGFVPAVQYKSLLTASRQFVARTLVAYGRQHQRTLLAMPPVPLPSRVAPIPNVDPAAPHVGIDDPEARVALSPDFVALLEERAVEWVKQIRAAVSCTPQDTLPLMLQGTGRRAGPLDEVAFWRDKAENLRQLAEQLAKPQALKTLTILRRAESTHYAALAESILEVDDSLTEATEAHSFLAPLTAHFERISPQAAAPEPLQDLSSSGAFRTLFHLLFTVWSRCERFATPVRMVNLISEIAADIVANARHFVDGRGVFDTDTADVVAQLGSVLKAVGEFKACYFHYKARTARELPSKPWRFQNAALFRHLDSFLERIHDVLDLADTSALFNKLEHVRLGGPTGIDRSVGVDKLRQRFNDALQTLAARDDDVLDVDAGRDIHAEYLAAASAAAERIAGMRGAADGGDAEVSSKADMAASTAAAAISGDGTAAPARADGRSTIGSGLIVGGTNDVATPGFDAVAAANDFETAYDYFREEVKDIERALATILADSVDESVALGVTFKVVDSFDGFTERPIMHQEWAGREAKVLAEWHADLLCAQEEFHRHKDKPLPLPRTPTASGVILWCHALLQRIDAHWRRIEGLSTGIVESDAGADALRLHSALRQRIQAHMAVAHERWAAGVATAAGDRLQLPVLTMCEVVVPEPDPLEPANIAARTVLGAAADPSVSALARRESRRVGADGQLTIQDGAAEESTRGGIDGTHGARTAQKYVVNFDPELVKALRDVAHIERVAHDGGDEAGETTLLIPPAAASLHRQKDTLRRQVLSLQYVCDAMNDMAATCLPCERALFTNELADAERLLLKGVESLAWSQTDAVTEFANEASETVRRIETAAKELRACLERGCELVTAFFSEERFLQSLAGEGGGRSAATSDAELRRRFHDHMEGRVAKAGKINAEVLGLLAETGLGSINLVKEQFGLPAADPDSVEWTAFLTHASYCLHAAIRRGVSGALQAMKDAIEPPPMADADAPLPASGPGAGAVGAAGFRDAGMAGLPIGLVTIRLSLVQPAAVIAQHHGSHGHGHGKASHHDVPVITFDPPLLTSAGSLAGGAKNPDAEGVAATQSPEARAQAEAALTPAAQRHLDLRRQFVSVQQQRSFNRAVAEMSRQVVELARGFHVPSSTGAALIVEANAAAVAAAAAAASAELAGGSRERAADGHRDEVDTAQAALLAAQARAATFEEPMLSDPAVHGLLVAVEEALGRAADACASFRRAFTRYGFLHETTVAGQFESFVSQHRPSTAGSGVEDPAGDGTEDAEEGEAPAERVDVEGDGGGALESAAARPPDAYFGVPLLAVDAELRRMTDLEDELEDLPASRVVGLVRVDSRPLKHGLIDLCRQRRARVARHVFNRMRRDVDGLYDFMQKAERGLRSEVSDGDVDTLKGVMAWIRACRERDNLVQRMLAPLAEAATMLKQHPAAVDADELAELEERRQPALESWLSIHRLALNMRETHSVAQDREAENIHDEAARFDSRVAATAEALQQSDLHSLPPPETFGVNPQTGVPRGVADYLDDCAADGTDAYTRIDDWAGRLREVEADAERLRSLQQLFDLTPSEHRLLRDARQELVSLKRLWDLTHHILLSFRDWMGSPFRTVDVDAFQDEIKRLTRQLKLQPLAAREWALFRQVEAEVTNMAKTLPLCAELRSPAMRGRHWEALLELCGHGAQLDPNDESFTLQHLVSLGVHSHSDAVLEIVERAQKELAIEKALERVVSGWGKAVIEYDPKPDLDVVLIANVDAAVEQLEADSNTLQSMMANRYVGHFLVQVSTWQKNLGLVDTCLNKWVEIQRRWLNLFPIFVLSADIREQLPADARNFANADELFRALMRSAQRYTGMIEVMCTNAVVNGMERPADTLETVLNSIEAILLDCERALTEYLETKRKVFPRFFFVSASDLVDILSKGSDPRAVMIHMSKIIDSVEAFTIDHNPRYLPPPGDEEDDAGVALSAAADASPNTPPMSPGSSAPRSRARAAVSQQNLEPYPTDGVVRLWEMVSVQGERVLLPEDCRCEGAVELWLASVVRAMQAAMRRHIGDAHGTYVDRPRTEWIYEHPCQAVIVASRSWFTTECHSAFHQLEEGAETAMKDFLKQQKVQLDLLIKQVLKDQQSNARKMLVHLITIDVHNRDVIQMLVDDKVDAADSFVWQSQLRYYFDERRGSEVRICDALFNNGYEYIGLCGCLVVTPLTDRCYITLSQALKLNKGGAPAGPAGTGKTETTKDLARNLGMCCYVFNCSDQMNYVTLGQIFKGLAMTGAWGCFDEFNRISIEVLSVVATQVGSILNGLKGRRQRFRFMSEEIPLVASVGIFITMNPGYAGRTELPENIKSLFRPCAMVVPDLKNICEIMLAAEGFGDAKDLALKFVTLYRLNKELLSPQDHYDWGLRAVKSVLYIAGALKRQDPEVPERKVLMRALRDTNLAKLSKDDVYVFMGLIRALFPNVDIAKKDQPQLKQALLAQCKAMGNFPGENDIFVLKGMQFDELLHVRHSVFILGPTGCGKTQVWRCLQGGLARMGNKCVTQPLNPKAITSNELYGYIHTQTKEWHDGILSQIFRNFYLESKSKKHSKWIVLDGIIDAEWIESMNTVMDDNKVLTLVSNERIPLSDSMRLVFEVSHLANASPATVSRAGVLFINESDLGWGPFRDKWLASLPDDREATHLEGLLDRYMPLIFEYWKRSMKPIVHVVDLNVVETMTRLLESLLATVPREKKTPEVYEKYVAFACIWAFGGPLPTHDGGRIDYRAQFSQWWRKEFPGQKFGETGTVFDFFVDQTSPTFDLRPWAELVQPYVPDPDVPLAAVSVPTADTVRISALLDLLMGKGHAVMLVGTAGTGKTNMLTSRLRAMDNNEYMYRVIAFNARTGSTSLQTALEQSLEKRSGRQFGPPGRKKITFFLDDVNMANPDKYGTQEAMALLQQHIDYGFWYDRSKIIQKDVVDVRFAGAMNPKSGTFTIIDRVLRHFSLFSACMPERSDLELIYGQLLDAHLSQGFSRDVRSLAPVLTKATLELHQAVLKTFLPTAVLFHYHWNMRELFNIVQGVCCAHPHFYSADPAVIARLWAHECTRTFRDRMPTEGDANKFDGLLRAVQRTCFVECGVSMDDFLKGDVQQLLWAPTASTPAGDENIYEETSLPQALELLHSRLAEYNTQFATMDLVLFTEAVEHVCRAARVMARPLGNAMLVGVGGSGKQSLARLAAFLTGLEVFQLTVTGSYTAADFRAEAQTLYRRAGLKAISTAFIVTDQQIVIDDMLVYLNDMLSSGNVPDLFPQEDRDAVVSSMSNEAKAAGVQDYANPDVCWDFFINKVRTHLHVVLCFSPVAPTFAVWCRQFPALCNTTTIDWYHPWPLDALRSVAKRFLGDVEFDSVEPLPPCSDPDAADPSLPVADGVAEFIAECHMNITETAESFYSETRRRCFTTPKSFLELIALFKALLGQKREELDQKRDRLLVGRQKIEDAGEQVAGLQEILVADSAEVDEARAKTQGLLEHVSSERALVEEQSAVAAQEEAKTNVIVQEVQQFAEECHRDLEAAQPLVKEAKAALDTLKKSDLTELKSMTRPPDDVVMVCATVKILMSDPRRVPGAKERDWAACKKMMGNVDQWMKALLAFDQDNIPQPCVDAIQPYVTSPGFVATNIETKSVAAASLCKWVIGMNEYHKVRCHVRPKEEKLAEAQERLTVSRSQLKRVQDKVAELEEKLGALVAQYDAAVTEANRIEAKAQLTRTKMSLATRLVDGLADEKVRWGKITEELGDQRKLLVGDALLAAAFVSYVGPFTRDFRDAIVADDWMPRIRFWAIPQTEGVEVMSVLTTDATIAQWNNDGLPSDPVSSQNGAIVTNCARWPLMIDPQLQAVRWIRTREETNGLVTLIQGQRGWLDKVATCVEDGLPCLIESLGESIDPSLNNVLGRVTYLRGGRKMMRIGVHDVQVSPKFRLYLQTRMSNPTYQPEVNAQTTLVNCMVTEAGLEDQLLAVVVDRERPELEEKRVSLHRHMNTMTIELQQCEDSLLYELSNAKGDILENVALVETLEATKRKATEITRSMAQARETQKSLVESRQTFRLVATRGALLFFQIDQMHKIAHMYQYSLEAFMVVFLRALEKAPQPGDAAAADTPQAPATGSKGKRTATKSGGPAAAAAAARVDNLVTSVTESVFGYVARGLFERHKLVLSTLLCIAIQKQAGQIHEGQLQYLLLGTRKYTGVERPEPVRDWVSDATWAMIQGLATVDGASPPFAVLPHELAESNRWRQWAELEKPELERMPSDWKALPPFQRLLILRCLRPDRLTNALEQYVAKTLGPYFVADQAVDLTTSYGDAGVSTPIFFILSPGVDPVSQVETLGKRLGYTYDNERLYNVSLGQGQEAVAEAALATCFKEGGWALLSNVHLVERWMRKLDHLLDSYSEVYVKMAQRAKRKQDRRAAKVLAWRNARRRASEAAVVASRRVSLAAGQLPQAGDASRRRRGSKRRASAASEGAEGAEDEEVAAAAAEEKSTAEAPPTGPGDDDAAGHDHEDHSLSASAEEDEEGEESEEEPPEFTDSDPSSSDEADGTGEGIDEDAEIEAEAALMAAAADGDEAAAEQLRIRQEKKQQQRQRQQQQHGGRAGAGAGGAGSPGAADTMPKKGSKDFRLFLSAEPNNGIPVGVLQRSIKLTSEPPSGIALNVKRALGLFHDEPWERSSKPMDFRAVTFAMCFFHAVVVERKKFGPQGWNRVYPFNIGDLTTCIDVLAAYVEDRPKVPWDDLRYVFGEIMYGGHITDDWDRVLCMAYLRQWVTPEAADGLELAPGFHVPPPGTCKEYIQYVDENCPPESPALYGMHANAEVSFRTKQAEALFTAIRELRPPQADAPPPPADGEGKKPTGKKPAGGKGVDAAAAATATRRRSSAAAAAGHGAADSAAEVMAARVSEMIDKLPELFNLADISERLDEDRTPPQHVFYQECERMNIILVTLRRSLGELQQGLAGVLSLTGPMLAVRDSIAADRVPDVVQRVSFASLRGLASWFDNMCQRHVQLMDWTAELVMPRVTQLPLLVSPVAFLTAISQQTAIANKYDLDQMALVFDVLKKAPDQIDAPARDGAHMYGLAVEGARWDASHSTLDDGRLGELYPRLPVVTVRALPATKADRRDQYEAPLYKTAQRGHTFVASVWLRTKQPAAKWTVAGVGLLLDVSE